MTLAVLKATYYRAVTEQKLRVEYFDRKQREYDIRWEKYSKEFSETASEILGALRSGNTESLEDFMSKPRSEATSKILSLTLGVLATFSSNILPGVTLDTLSDLTDSDKEMLMRAFNKSAVSSC